MNDWTLAGLMVWIPTLSIVAAGYYLWTWGD